MKWLIKNFLFFSLLTFLSSFAFSQETLDSEIVAITCYEKTEVTTFFFTKKSEVLIKSESYADEKRSVKTGGGLLYGRIGMRQGNVIGVDMLEAHTSASVNGKDSILPVDERVRDFLRWTLKVNNFITIDNVEILGISRNEKRNLNVGKFIRCERRWDGLNIMKPYIDEVRVKYTATGREERREKDTIDVNQKFNAVIRQYCPDFRSSTAHQVFKGYVAARSKLENMFSRGCKPSYIESDILNALRLDDKKNTMWSNLDPVGRTTAYASQCQFLATTIYGMQSKCR